MLPNHYSKKAVTQVVVALLLTIRSISEHKKECPDNVADVFLRQYLEDISNNNPLVAWDKSDFDDLRDFVLEWWKEKS